MDLNKYSIKRLREIVKYHNKNIRSAVMAYKKAELKKHIIKVTDYKTKDALVKRMMESHNQLLKGSSLPSIDKVIKAIGSKGPDAKIYYLKEMDEIADRYNTIKDKDKAKKFINYAVKELGNTGDAAGYDRNLSGAELKKEIKKIAKQNLKDDKEVDDDYDKAAKSVRKPKAKAKAVPKAKPVFNNFLKKVAQSKPAEQKKQIKAIVKISKKVNDKTSKLIGKTIMGQFAIELNKTSNPSKVFEELIKQYNLKNPPKSNGKGKLISQEEANDFDSDLDSDFDDLELTPRTHNGKQYGVDEKTDDAYLMEGGEPEPVGKWKDITSKKAGGKVTISKQKQDFSDVEDILDTISQKYINLIVDRIEDKKFGTDWKKWNKAVSESIDNYKTDSDKAGVKKSLIDMFKKDRMIPEIVETAGYYIKQFKLKGVHVMDITGKIMEDKKMPAKSK
tara:strand:+ start:186 stop:1526 length:1341 start_codon:yes stop_codon:yes gene_type:complete